MLIDELTLWCSCPTWLEDICLLRSSRVARNRQSHPRLVNTTREAHRGPVCLGIERERRVVQQVDARLRPVGRACSQLRGQLPSVQNKPITPPRNRHFAQYWLGVATEVRRDGARVDVGCQLRPASHPRLSQGQQLSVHLGGLVE